MSELKANKRAAFFGSPAEAVCVLDAALAAGFDVVAVFTRGDKRSRRGGEAEPTPVGAAARAAGVPVYSPAQFDDGVCAELRALTPDIFITAAYGRFLPPELLAIPPFGTVNLHPSLLPRYRGASPVAGAILDGATTTGLTFMLVNERWDAGDIIAQTPPVAVAPTARKDTLQAALFREGARLAPRALGDWMAGRVKPRKQDESQATFTRQLTKRDGLIDWRLPAERLERMTRAYYGWPGAYTYWGDKPLKILEARASAQTAEVGRVGFGADAIQIGSGAGSLLATKLQIGSRNAADAADIMNGYPQLNGAFLRDAAA